MARKPRPRLRPDFSDSYRTAASQALSRNLQQHASTPEERKGQVVMKGAAVLVALGAIGSLAAGNPVLGATPTVFAGDATITGAGDIVQVSRMPVQTSS